MWYTCSCSVSRDIDSLSLFKFPIYDFLIENNSYNIKLNFEVYNLVVFNIVIML